MTDKERIAKLEKTLKWVQSVAWSGQPPALALSRIGEEVSATLNAVKK